MNNKVRSDRLNPDLSLDTKLLRYVAATSATSFFLCVLVFSSLSNKVELEFDTRQDLSQRAIYVTPRASFSVGDLDATFLNYDIDRDGHLESVLMLEDERVSSGFRLLEHDGDSIRIRSYKVVAGQIEYTDR